MTRRVVMLTNLVPPDRLGGLGRYVRELASALQRRGSEVTVLTKQVDRTHPPVEVGDDGVTVLRDPTPEGGGVAFWARYPGAVRRSIAARLADVAGPDVVVHGHYAFPTSRVDTRGGPLVYTFHAPVHREVFADSERRVPPVVVRAGRARVRAVEREVLGSADAVVTLSDFMAREALAVTPGVADRLHLVPGGLDTAAFSPAASPRAGAGGSSRDAPRVFAARRLVRRTGVGELVRAMPRVLEAVPAATLRVAGDGPLADELRRLVSGLGLVGRVELLGRISDEQLVREYQDADLVVTPTQELEGFGLATAEAMACATPVLVTPVGANPELVRTLGAQHVTADATPAALADGVLALLGGGALPPQQYRRVAETWSWDAVAARYEALYDEVGTR